MFHLHRRQSRLPTLELVRVGFLLCIGNAAIVTVWSLFMDSLGMSASAIGFLSSMLVAIGVAVSLTASYILERWSLGGIVVTSLLLSAGSYIFIALTRSITLFIALSVIVTVMSVMRVTSFSIAFRDSTDDASLNKAEGILFVFYNAGFLVGPLIAGFFMVRWGLPAVLVVGAGFITLSAAIFMMLHIPEKPVKVQRTPIMSNIKAYFKDRQMYLPYLMAAGIAAWWSLIYVYVPLIMVHHGLGDFSVGIFLSLVIVPLLLVEFVVGKLSAKIGFRKFFIAGYVGLALLALAAFFISNIYAVVACMVIASFFAGCVEPLQDTYFFRKVKKDDEKRYYPLFSTSASAGSFVGKLVVAGFLLLLPEGYAFIVTAGLMMLFAAASFRISERSPSPSSQA